MHFLVYCVPFHVYGGCLVVWCGLFGLMVVDSRCDLLLVVGCYLMMLGCCVLVVVVCSLNDVCCSS